jgi:alpha-methylacyl-CoA racemase
LKPGEGGEETLRQWMGWSRGRDYDISAQGAFEKKEKSKL